MATAFRKRSTSVRTPASKSGGAISWRLFARPALLLLALLSVYIVYSNWSGWLSLLDKTPIKAYALTHKTQFTTNSDIREVLSTAPKLKGYFEQNIQQVKDKFLTIPWVKEVAVRKIYPDRLSITLVEHRPVAIWNDQFLVSDQGQVFSLPEDRFERQGLPKLYGPDSESKKVLGAWYKIQNDLQSRHLSLKSVMTDIRGSWSIVLDNNIELRLGRGDWLPKIDRFVLIFPEIDVPKGKRLAYVDLRYEHGASVGFRLQ